jgi:hypothetical protein
MAYPSVSAPYGLIPINLIGGQVFAGATRQIPIATNSSTAIFYGDVVRLADTGTLAKDTGTTAATPVGVFLGCSYTDPVFGKTFRQFYPGTTNISDVVAYVQDDPDALFKCAVVTAFNSTTISYVNRTSVGNNAVLAQNAGSTITGNSQVAITAATNTTSTWPIRVIDVVPETALAGNPGSYTEVIVKWNQGMHQYLNPTGV